MTHLFCCLSDLWGLSIVYPFWYLPPSFNFFIMARVPSMSLAKVNMLKILEMTFLRAPESTISIGNLLTNCFFLDNRSLRATRTYRCYIYIRFFSYLTVPCHSILLAFFLKPFGSPYTHKSHLVCYTVQWICYWKSVGFCIIMLVKVKRENVLCGLVPYRKLFFFFIPNLYTSFLMWIVLEARLSRCLFIREGSTSSLLTW